MANYKFKQYSFSASWYKEYRENCEYDTSKLDNDVIAVLEEAEEDNEWDLEADEIDYSKCGIWVENNDSFPYNFTVIDPEKSGG